MFCKKLFALSTAALISMISCLAAQNRDRGATVAPNVQKPLTGPTEKSAQTVKHVIKVLTEQHLTKRTIDDETVRRWFKLLLKDLDSSKLFLTQGDVAQFETRLKDQAERFPQGDITLAYEMFKKTRERVDERMKLAAELLNDELPLTGNEEYITDPDKAPFAKDDQHAKELWRKRLMYELLLHLADKAPLAEAKDRVRKRLETQRTSFERFDDELLLETTLSALAGSFDPLSRHLGSRSWADFLESNRGEFYGVGIQVNAIDDGAAVLRILPGGPAHKDGRLQAGDKIVGVDPTGGDKLIPCAGKTLTEMVSMIRGKAGDKVRLEIIPAGQAERVLVTLERGIVPTARAHGVVLEAGKKADGKPFRVGYLYLPSLYGAVAGLQSQSSSADVRRVLSEGGQSLKAEGADLLLLDLRTNSGGVMREMIAIAECFIPKGPLYMVKDRAGKVFTVDGVAQKEAWEGPLVVLTSRHTSSGAEMLAGALQSYGRALIVGEPTTGLGTIQSLVDIVDGKGATNATQAALRFTNQQFYRPNGESTQKRGVIPDIVLPWLAAPPVGESSRVFALEADRVDSARFERFPFGIDEKLRAKFATFPCSAGLKSRSSRTCRPSSIYKQTLRKPASWS